MVKKSESISDKPKKERVLMCEDCQFKTTDEQEAKAHRKGKKHVCFWWTR